MEKPNQVKLAYFGFGDAQEAAKKLNLYLLRSKKGNIVRQECGERFEQDRNECFTLNCKDGDDLDLQMKLKEYEFEWIQEV